MTIKEIAELCGVSRGTVDRVVNHRGRVKPETEQLVLEAVQKAGFTKNMAGRALTVRRMSPVIGVVLCGLGNPFFDDVLSGIARAESELHDWGVQVELRNLQGYDLTRQLEAMDELGKVASALVVQPINDDAVKQKIAALADAGIPTITINSDLEASRRAVYVGSDYYRGGLAAGGMLTLCCAQGARVGIAAGSRAILGHAQRLQGFLDGLGTKLTVTDLFYGEDHLENIYRGTLGLLRRFPETDAFFVAAAGCASACQAVIDAGREGHVAVLGFDRVPDNVAMMRRGIVKALICQQPERQGHDAVRAAWSLLLNEGAEQERLLVDNQIRIAQNVDEQ